MFCFVVTGPELRVSPPEAELQKDLGILRKKLTLEIWSWQVKWLDHKADKDKEKRVARSNEEVQHLWKI